MKLSILFAFLLQITMIFGISIPLNEERFLDTSIKTMDKMIDNVREDLET